MTPSPRQPLITDLIRYRRWLPAAVSMAFLLVSAGCGGARSRSDNETDASQGDLGPIVTRAYGTAQPPVGATGRSAVVTGLAGAWFDSITEIRTAPPSVADSRIAFARLTDDGHY